MTIRKYFELWKKFDFFTFMSDDFSIYRKGRIARSEMKELTMGDETLLKIWQDFTDYDDSLGQNKKPTLDDYI